MKEGYGTFYYADGTKYVGYWANDKYNGQGVTTLSNGDRYEGSFKNGLRNGNGTYYSTGLMISGALMGKLIYNQSGIKCFNYSSYEEPFIKGDLNVNYTDYRQLFYKYVGEWVDGELHGQGSIAWTYGGRYEGSFINGTRTGYGVYHCVDGSKCMGQWVDGMMNGEGVCQYIDGTRYEGTFKNHAQHGNGTYYMADGTKYVCKSTDNKDEKYRHCLITWSNGDQYDGFPKNQKALSGNGTYYFADASKYMITWLNGRLVNHGVFISTNGSRYEGPILDSKLRVMKIIP
jgi:hypothetical protein